MKCLFFLCAEGIALRFISTFISNTRRNSYFIIIHQSMSINTLEIIFTVYGCRSNQISVWFNFIDWLLIILKSLQQLAFTTHSVTAIEPYHYWTCVAAQPNNRIPSQIEYISSVKIVENFNTLVFFTTIFTHLFLISWTYTVFYQMNKMSIFSTFSFVHRKYGSHTVASITTDHHTNNSKWMCLCTVTVSKISTIR